MPIDGNTVVAVHNLADADADADADVTAKLTLDGSHGLVDQLADGRTVVSDGGQVELSLAPYGCWWLRAERG